MVRRRGVGYSCSMCTCVCVHAQIYKQYKKTNDGAAAEYECFKKALFIIRYDFLHFPFYAYPLKGMSHMLCLTIYSYTYLCGDDENSEEN